MSPQDQQAMTDFRKTLDTSKFTLEPYVRRVEKPWGFELHFVRDGLPYMSKVLHVNEGEQLSTQVHDTKQEAWIHRSGNIILVLEDSDGNMQEIQLEENKGYTCALGQKHTLKGGPGGGEVFEASTEESGNTYRVEDKYKRSTETEEAREKRNAESTLG